MLSTLTKVDRDRPTRYTSVLFVQAARTMAKFELVIYVAGKAPRIEHYSGGVSFCD